MTYTNAWTTERPLGSAQLNTADDEIRALRLDLQERLNDVVFEDMSADPVAIKQSSFGTKSGKTLIVHGVQFIVEGVAAVNYSDNGISNVASAQQPIRAWVPLPNNVTITKIEWLITNNDATATDLILGSLQFEEGLSVTTEHSMSSNVSGTNIADSGEVAISTGTDKTFFLKADRGGGDFFAIHAVRITYDTPDGRSTI